MRKLALLIGLTLVMASASASAEGFDASVAVANAKAGIESIVTAPAGPVLGAIYGDDVLGLPLAPVTDRLVGLVTGTLGGAFALVTGAVDVVFAIPATLVGIGPVSPEPVIDLF